LERLIPGIATEPGGERITESGLVPGTLRYMAPEQKAGEVADERSDLYSMGLILEEMLEGDSHDPGNQSTTRSTTDVTHRVAPVLRSLLAEDRDNRYESAGTVASELRNLRIDSSWIGWMRDWKGWVTTSTTRAALVSSGLVIILAVTGLFVLWPIVFPPQPPTPPAQIYYERGMHYLTEEVETERNLNDAMNMFNRSITLDSTYARSWAMLGDASWRQFEHTHEPSYRERAEQSIARALEISPYLPEAFNARARGLIYEGLYKEAQAQARRATEINPLYDMAWANLGRAHQKQGNYDEGLKAINQAIKLNPKSFQHQMFLGNFFQHFREYDAAIEAYAKAADLKPDSPMAWNNVGTIYLQTGKPENAIEAFTKCLEITDWAATRTNLGIAYYMMGEYEKAIPHYQRATEIEPGVASYWGNLGEAMRILGREPEAVDAFQHAVELAEAKVELTPLDPQSRRRLALWCARARDLECAHEQAQYAYELQPESAEILLMNAVTCSLQGNVDQALEWLEKSINFGMGRAEIKMEPDLTALRNHPKYQELLGLAG
jgi:tetratricopeptide (TPR) repeat protein